MSRYAAALSQHPIPAHAVGEVAGSVLEQLDGEPPDLVVYFVSPHFVGALDDMSAALRRLLEPGVLIGMTTAAVIGGAFEAELVPALSVWAGSLDGPVTPVGLRMVNTPDGPAVSGWPRATSRSPPTWTTRTRSSCSPIRSRSRSSRSSTGSRGPSPACRSSVGWRRPPPGPGGNRLALDGELADGGAVGVLLGGDDRVRAVVSQGCRPVGSAYIVTDVGGQRHPRARRHARARTARRGRATR